MLWSDSQGCDIGGELLWNREVEMWVWCLGNSDVSVKFCLVGLNHHCLRVPQTLNHNLEALQVDSGAFWV